MTSSRFQELVKECIEEVLLETGRRVCAWCKKDMGAMEDGQPGDSHGICPDCAAKFQQDLEQWHMEKDNDRSMKQAGSKFV